MAVKKQGGRSPGWGGGRREHAGVRRGGPFCGQGPHDCLLRSCSGRCAAQLPGGRLTRLSSPHWCLPTRDQARACSREKGICEQPFPLPAAGVCRAGSHCRDVITRRRVTHGSACLPLGLTAAGRCSPLADTMWFLGSSFVTAPPHAGHGSRGEPQPLFYSSLPIPCREGVGGPCTSFPLQHLPCPWSLYCVPQDLSCPFFILQWVMPELRGLLTCPQQESVSLENGYSVGPFSKRGCHMTDIWGQIIPSCGGDPVHCRLFSSIPLDANGTPRL